MGMGKGAVRVKGKVAVRVRGKVRVRVRVTAEVKSREQVEVGLVLTWPRTRLKVEGPVKVRGSKSRSVWSLETDLAPGSPRSPATFGQRPGLG